MQDYTTRGRKRLLPWFGELKLTAIDEERVRAWLAEMAELVTDGGLSAKTVNNARTWLSMTSARPSGRRHAATASCSGVGCRDRSTSAATS